jgi:hypothetical protein
MKLDDMYAPLFGLNYRSPLFNVSSSQGVFVCIPKPSLFFWCTNWLIYVPNSNVCAMPILGYPWWLLLLLFIKLDNASKCGVAWFIMKELNKSFISRILSRLVLWLVVCILSIPIKRFSNFDLLLDFQLTTNLLPVGTYPSSIFYHQPSWKLSSRPDIHLIACSKSLLVVCSVFFSMDSFQLVKLDHEEKCISIINDVPFITHIHAVKWVFWASKQMVPQSVLVGASFQHSFKYNYTITLFKSHSQVGDGNPRWRCPSSAALSYQLLLKFT